MPLIKLFVDDPENLINIYPLFAVTTIRKIFSLFNKWINIFNYYSSSKYHSSPKINSFKYVFQDLGFEDTLKLENVIAGLNLQWRRSLCNGQIPMVFASELTSFVYKSRCEHLQNCIDKFNNLFKSVVSALVYLSNFYWFWTDGGKK